MISTSASSFLTVSPSCFSHWPIVPSFTDSPSCGIVILVGIDALLCSCASSREGPLLFLLVFVGESPVMACCSVLYCTAPVRAVHTTPSSRHFPIGKSQATRAATDYVC